MEYIIKTQIELLEMKNIISDVNNTLNGTSCRLETAEGKKNSEIEGIIIETIHIKTHRPKKILRKQEQRLSEL